MLEPLATDACKTKALLAMRGRYTRERRSNRSAGRNPQTLTGKRRVAAWGIRNENPRNGNNRCEREPLKMPLGTSLAHYPSDMNGRGGLWTVPSHEAWAVFAASALYSRLLSFDRYP